MAIAKKPRKPTSKKTRFEIFKRDGFKCQYCGSHPPDVLLHVDHIISVRDGGENDPDNLVTSCEACNLGKGAESLAHIPKPLSERAAETADREAQIAGYANVMDARRERLEKDTWRVCEELTPGAAGGYPRSQFASIKRFIDVLGANDVLDAAEIAVSKGFYEKRQFTYFCGVCWTKMKEGKDG